MGGGMYGGGMGGMYGGGMYGGGMYGGGMQGNNSGQQGFFEKAQMYIFQLCEIAQMVEFNASGLAAFYTTLKNVSIAAL